jgi:hypothetical protein
MITHTSLPVVEYAKSKAFYARALDAVWSDYTRAREQR